MGNIKFYKEYHDYHDSIGYGFVVGCWSNEDIYHCLKTFVIRYTYKDGRIRENPDSISLSWKHFIETKYIEDKK